MNVLVFLLAIVLSTYEVLIIMLKSSTLNKVVSGELPTLGDPLFRFGNFAGAATYLDAS